MYALKVLFTLSHIKQVDSRLLIQSTMELEEAFAFQTIHKGSFARCKHLDLTFQLFLHLDIVCFQNPGISERVTIVKHFFEMCTAEALLIGHIAYVSLHVRGTMTKYKIHDVILGAFFYIAEGAFTGIVKGV